MNIFDIYLDRIIEIINRLNKDGLIKIPISFNNINVDIPPKNFDCDISTNVAMVLSKINNKSPNDLAKQLVEIIKNDDPNIDIISIAKPGFINIKIQILFLE